MKKIFLILLLLSPSLLFSQSFNDGPIKVDVTLQEVQGFFEETDEALLGVGFAPDELVFYIWAQDNLGIYPWTGGTCFQDPNFDPTLSGTNSINFNSTFASFNFTNTIVPQFLDLRIDAWEDDNPDDGLLGFCTNGTSTSFEDIQCSGFGVPGLCNSFFGNICFSNPSCPTYYTNLQSGTTSDDCCLGIFCSDDYRCNANPFYQGLDYRLGSPCQTYDHGYVNGNNSCDPNYSLDPSQPNTDGFYKPHIETFWRYTNGTSFNNAIDLGALPSYPSNIQHFNSNECYTNYYILSIGNDVIYSFDITNTTGVNISLCGASGAQFDSYLYLVNGADTNTFITSNDNSCGSQSQITESMCNIGKYYIVVDANSQLDLGTFTLTITEDPLNTFSVVDSTSNYNGQDISCNGGSDGKFYAHINGGTPPYTFAWSNGLTHTTNNYNDSIIGLSAGPYSVTVNDSKGCTLPLISITFVEPNPIVIAANLTPTSCNGYADGTISITNTSGGTPSYSYIWNSTPLQTGSNATGLSQGTYAVTIEDDNGCTATAQYLVTEPAAPSMNITSSNPIISSNPITYEACDGNDIILTASGLVSYFWSPNVWLNTISGPTVISSPNPPGITYTCTGTDVSGCTVDIPIIVDVVSAVNIYASDPSPHICEGEDVVITFSGAATYSWFPPTYLSTTNGATVTITPQDTITYTIIAQNSSGCTDETKFFVDFLPAPNINAISPIPAICFDSSVPITASGANSYIWSPSSSLNINIGSVVTSSPAISTQYKVVGTDLNGCKDSSFITISVIPLPVLYLAGSNNICDGESTPLSVSGANSYIWTPSTSLNTSVGNLVIANPSTSQTYTITGTDINQCVGTTSHSVSVLPVPNVSVIATEDTICIGNSSNLTANGASSYIWSPSSSLNINTTTVVSATPTSTTIYSVIGNDVNNCSSTSLITINVNPLPILNVIPLTKTICEGESLGMMASGAQDFIWSPALGLNTTIGPNVIATPIINSFYTITGTDINGCSDIISSIIHVDPKPIITLSPSSADICEGASVSISSFGADSYLWSPAFGLNSTTNSSVIANPNATTNYTVLGIDFNDCTNTTNFQLNVGINPTIAIAPENPVICEGDNISITASGASQYIWKPATTLSAGVGIVVSASPNVSTTYTLVGTDSIGCVDSISTTISVNPLPIATINQNSETTICSGDSAVIIVDLSGNPAWNLSYALNGAFQKQINATTNPTLILVDISGEYTIPFVTDANGCSDEGNGNLMLNVLNRPLANFDFFPQPANMLSPQITFTNNSIFANTWYWDYGDGFSNAVDYSPLHTYFENGTYQVSLVVMNDICSDTIQHTLTIDPVYTLYVPDVFTPNNDGLNDVFYPKGKGIADFEMYIYNSWGELVFYSIDINEGWSGRINSDSKFMSGYFSYVINITDDLGVYHFVKGKVLLN